MAAFGRRVVILAAGADMSSIARWSYKNVATVRPVLGLGEYGEATYGEPYVIACNWTAENITARQEDGQEFVGRHTIYTEDLRPQFGDEIQFLGSAGYERIRSRTCWDMELFSDTPDVRLVT